MARSQMTSKAFGGEVLYLSNGGQLSVRRIATPSDTQIPLTFEAVFRSSAR